MADTETVASPAADAGARVSDAELADLRAQLQRKTDTEEALRRRNDTLERERNDAHRRISSEVDQRFNAEEQAIESGMAAASADAERLEEQITDHNEKGEFREATKLTRELATAQTRIDGFAWRREQIKSVKERAKAEAATAGQDPLARYGAPNSPTRRWIDAHPKFLSDDLYHHDVVGAHKRALRDGHDEGSDEYFAFIERAIGERKDKTTEAPIRKTAPEPEPEEEAPMSDAADTVSAGEPEIEVEEPTEEESGEIEMDEQAVRQAQAKAATRRTEEARRPSNKTSSGAPPSRGAVGAAPAKRTEMKLTRDEAERAIADYPPGKYMIDNQEFEVKTQMDAWRLYHSAREKLRAENRIGSGVVR